MDSAPDVRGRPLIRSVDTVAPRRAWRPRSRTTRPGRRVSTAAVWLALVSVTFGAGWGIKAILDPRLPSGPDAALWFPEPVTVQLVSGRDAPAPTTTAPTTTAPSAPPPARVVAANPAVRSAVPSTTVARVDDHGDDRATTTTTTIDDRGHDDGGRGGRDGGRDTSGSSGSSGGGGPGPG